ncbi:MAG: ribosome-binding factor A, partial [Candidatus Marinimicrobia bacterium]|nr:ribosome-binding factor A [Candidatus Neomarinimicrobiota bacterium]
MKSKKPYKRTDRVGNQILSILGDVLIKYIDLSHIGFVTFTHVDIAPDLRTAKVF